MAKVRVIKRTDGVVQTQHRGDEVYSDATLPEGTKPADVVAQVVVEVAQLADVLDAQVDIANGKLVKDLTKPSGQRQAAERRAAAAKTLGDLEADASVQADVKRYLVALRDFIGSGVSGSAQQAGSERR
jgi:3-hydroxyisobutyrate dehydrogenase-like beta-hydroxyacid dehydrogenase